MQKIKIKPHLSTVITENLLSFCHVVKSHLTFSHLFFCKTEWMIWYNKVDPLLCKTNIAVICSSKKYRYYISLHLLQKWLFLFVKIIIKKTVVFQALSSSHHLHLSYFGLLTLTLHLQRSVGYGNLD